MTQSQASKIRRALIKTDRLSERQNQGNLVTQSHGSKVTIINVTMIARLPKSFCRDTLMGGPCFFWQGYITDSAKSFEFAFFAFLAAFAFKGFPAS